MNKHFALTYEPKKSNEVLAKTYSFFEENVEIKRRYEELSQAYQNIGKLIPNTTENLWSGHFFPFTESWDELQISFNLVLFGLYKQAFTSLRSGLEIGMLSVYYNINDEGHRTVKNWLNSKDCSEANTPSTNTIWKMLKTNNSILEFNKMFDLEGKFKELRFLHNYVHTKGYKFSNCLGLRKSNWQTFESTALMQWIDTYESIITLIITLHMLKYPISIIEFEWHKKIGIDNPFPVLNKSEIDGIKELLPLGHIYKIEAIANKDKDTQDLFQHIYEMPDMTDEEKETQLLNFDKSMIEHGDGFIQWEIRERKLIEKYSEELKKKSLKKIEIIREWAIENDMMKPKKVRLE